MSTPPRLSIMLGEPFHVPKDAIAAAESIILGIGMSVHREIILADAFRPQHDIVRKFPVYRAPVPEKCQDIGKAGTFFRQIIINPERFCLDDDSLDDTGIFQLAKMLDEHLMGKIIGNGFSQCAVSGAFSWHEIEIPDNVRFPFSFQQ